MTHLAIDPTSLDVLIKLGAAMLFGAVVGTERNISHKAAGMRTYALVSMGAAFFMYLAEILTRTYVMVGYQGISSLHVMAAVVTGIGFMGAGVIIFRDKSVTGLTTASGLWVASGIGLACGLGYYAAAFIATLLSLFVFEVLWHLEQQVKRVSSRSQDGGGETTP